MIANHITSSVDGINASYCTSLAGNSIRPFIYTRLRPTYALYTSYRLGLTSKRRTLLLCVILWQIWTLISSNHQYDFEFCTHTTVQGDVSERIVNVAKGCYKNLFCLLDQTGSNKLQCNSSIYNPIYYSSKVVNL